MIRGLEPGKRAALVISECQPAIIDPDFALSREIADQVAARGMLAQIDALAAACRAVDAPVIHCILRMKQVEDEPPACCRLEVAMRRSAALRDSSRESLVHPALGPHQGDLVSQRSNGLTGFHESDLENLLRGLGIQTIILAGVSTDLAIPGMAVEAINRKFALVIPEDCTSGSTPASHMHTIHAVLPVLATITQSAAIIQLLSARGGALPA